MLKNTKICIGIDEAGRGCLAGPVVASAVAFDRQHLPNKNLIDSLDDSKKMTPLMRRKVFDAMMNEVHSEYPCIAFGIGVVDSHIIDAINIRQATSLAMQRALDELLCKIPTEAIHTVLIDGRDAFRFSGLSKKTIAVVGGDAKIPEVSAASIIAKVFRDQLMESYALLYPGYGFETHKGYATAYHRSLLCHKSRLTGIHRLSFQPVKDIHERKPRLLLHVCCGPDASVPILDYKNDYEIIAFFYDPNIQPRAEYDKRLEAFKKVCSLEGIEWHEGEYDVDRFFQAIKGFEHTPEMGAKCSICYSLRLKRAVLAAMEYQCDAWTTSLNISPHKSYEKLTQIGKALEKQHGIEYLAIPFIKNNGFVRSAQYCKKNDIYRQNYCGCIYSDTYPGLKQHGDKHFAAEVCKLP